MSKSIDTLVEDIYAVVSSPDTIKPESAEQFGSRLGKHITARLTEERGQPSLRLSNLGTPCSRKLWYSIRTPELAEPLPPSAKLKFLFGDILEDLLLFLAAEAGHTVSGEQDTVSVNGVVGHRDAVIDGRLVDCKSASTYSFRKFESNGLNADDPFGYLTQLGTYLYASREDPLVKEKDVASFLVIDKTLGNVTLDTYRFGEDDYDKVVDEKRELLAKDEPPPREYDPVPEGKSGNEKLGIACSYCPFKKTCHPGLRTFLYSTGPVFLTEVLREPKVPELRDA